jgi:hypothetical protein
MLDVHASPLRRDDLLDHAEPLPFIGEQRWWVLLQTDGEYWKRSRNATTNWD